MRRAGWVWLCGVLLLGAACEVDEGDDADAGDTGGGDTADVTEPVDLCPDNELWQDSCLREFFSCFDVGGTCSIEDQGMQANLNTVALSWSEGGEWEERYDVVTSQLDIFVTDSGGALCASALDSTEGVDGERDLNFTEPTGSDTLRMRRDASNNMVITCPGGGENETYTATEADTVLGCLGVICEGEEPRDARP